MSSPVLSRDQPWRSRGDLLAARAAAVPRLERCVLAMGRTIAEAGLVVLAAVSLLIAGEGFSSGGGVDFGIGVVFSLFAVAGMGWTARWALAGHRCVSDLLAWDAAERDGRALPPGSVRPEDRTAWDARDDADFEQVAGAVGAAAYTRPWRNGLLLRAGLAGAGLVVGLVVALLGATSSDAPAFASCALVAGVWCFLCGAVTAVSSTRLSFRWTRVSAATDRDIREIRREREGRRGEPSSSR